MIFYSPKITRSSSDGARDRTFRRPAGSLGREAGWGRAEGMGQRAESIGHRAESIGLRIGEFGSRTRRRPIGRDYGAARMRKSEIETGLSPAAGCWTPIELKADLELFL